MTHPTKRKRKPRSNNSKTSMLARLNKLLGFAGDDLSLLNNGRWQDKLDEVYFAIYAAKRNRALFLSNFNRIATRESVREAQIGLKKALGDFQRRKTSTPRSRTFLTGGPETIHLDLAKQQLWFRENSDGPIESWHTTEHFPTMVYEALAEASCCRKFKWSDIRKCADDNCDNLFVPLRKPHKGKPAYCSSKCGNRVAALRYRRGKSEEFKVAERERSHSGYKKRVKIRARPTRVERNPRKLKK